MRPWIIDATPDHVHYISLHMRDRDFEEISAINYENTREELAESLAARFGNFKFAFCMGIGDEPICVLTGVSAYPGVWHIGMWATPELKRIRKFVTGICSNEFFGAMRACGAHRVECKSIVGYTEVHDWLRFLGFRQQDTVQEKYGKNGEDFLTFEWLEGMPWPRGYKPTAE